MDHAAIGDVPSHVTDDTRGFPMVRVTYHQVGDCRGMILLPWAQATHKRLLAAGVAAEAGKG